MIATNRDWKGDRLIRWHYERGGSIEHVHDRVKNDLAGHVLPCAEFGANAAWWRLQGLAWNIVRAMQLEILPEEFRQCHLKRLRFHLFCIAGRVIRHARDLILKLSGGASVVCDVSGGSNKNRVYGVFVVKKAVERSCINGEGVASGGVCPGREI